MAGWEAWAPAELEARRQRADRARERALRANDEAAWQHAEIVEQSYAQLTEMADGGEVYFARIVGALDDAAGDRFQVDVRVHKYARSEAFPVGPEEMLVISHLTALADLVRNPRETVVTLPLREADLMRWPELRGGGRLGVVQVTVEDVEMENGRVTRVAPRYGAVFEDRVRRRLAGGARPALDVLADVLDREQNQVINDRDARFRLTILDGPAGTGKTVVAAHRVAVLAPPGSPGLYLTPTPTLRDYVGPALPRLGLERGRVRVMSLEDVAGLLWPGWAPASGTDADRRDPGQWEGALQEARRALRAEALAPLQRRVAAALERVNPEQLAVGSAARVAHGALARFVRQPEKASWESLQGHWTAMGAVIREWPPWPGGGDPGEAEPARIYRRAAADLDAAPDPDLAQLILLAAVLGRTWEGPAPRWVIVDEAQFFPPAVFWALQRLVDPAAPFILAGDLLQRGRDQGLSSWDDARRALGLPKRSVRTIWLGKNYRVPARIHRAAERIRARLLPDSPASDSVPWHPVAGEIHREEVPEGRLLADRVAALVQAAEAAGVTSVAVLAPDSHRADLLGKTLTPLRACQRLDGRRAYAGGLAVGTMEDARGLEFDWVVLAGLPLEQYPPGALGGERLYTALTRARRSVFLLSAADEPGSPWLSLLLGEAESA